MGLNSCSMFRRSRSWAGAAVRVGAEGLTVECGRSGTTAHGPWDDRMPGVRELLVRCASGDSKLVSSVPVVVSGVLNGDTMLVYLLENQSDAGARRSSRAWQRRPRFTRFDHRCGPCCSGKRRDHPGADPTPVGSITPGGGGQESAKHRGRTGRQPLHGVEPHQAYSHETRRRFEAEGRGCRHDLGILHVK